MLTINSLEDAYFSSYSYAIDEFEVYGHLSSYSESASDLPTAPSVTPTQLKNLSIDIEDVSQDIFEIFPNPTDEDLILTATDLSGKIFVQKLIASDKLLLSEEIDLSDQPPGVYIIQLYNNSCRKIGKVIVF